MAVRAEGIRCGLRSTRAGSFLLHEALHVAGEVRLCGGVDVRVPGVANVPVLCGGVDVRVPGVANVPVLRGVANVPVRGVANVRVRAVANASPAVKRARGPAKPPTGPRSDHVPPA